jgi:endonuclease YncB( thermonuclease family)
MVKSQWDQLGCRYLFRLAVVALVSMTSLETFAANGSDQAVVVNGNTLIIGSRQIYLRGVEAPETDQFCLVGRVKWACGKQAARELSNKIGGNPVRCKIRGGDDADCYGSGVNLGAWMVSNGWALASNRVTIYAAEERKAKLTNRGIWRSEFVPPWSWRRGLRAGTSAVNSEARSCPIKGDITPSGLRIYYQPHNREYRRVQIDTGNNERWFCSIQQAEQAGWSAPRR